MGNVYAAQLWQESYDAIQLRSRALRETAAIP